MNIYNAAGRHAVMDTSYLAQQVTTIIGQLHGLFDEIGVASHERDSREAEVVATHFIHPSLLRICIAAPWNYSRWRLRYGILAIDGRRYFHLLEERSLPG